MARGERVGSAGTNHKKKRGVSGYERVSDAHAAA
jgi:hypothetical protein